MITRAPGRLIALPGATFDREREKMETLERTHSTKTTSSETTTTSDRSEPSFVEALVDPVSVFRHPGEVVEHPRFTPEEKRTILLSWARDELALEQVVKRAAPELRPQSCTDAVIEALSRFDGPAAGEYLSAVAAVRAQHL
jgi:hypothetical protein